MKSILDGHSEAVRHGWDTLDGNGEEVRCAYVVDGRRAVGRLDVLRN